MAASITTSENTTWTVLSLLDWSARFLTEKGFDSPRLTAELLLSRVLACRRIELYTNFDKPLSSDELAGFKSRFKRRLEHEPLQYILGDCEFMGLELSVDRRALIPRPETEILVEYVVKMVKGSSEPPGKILDVGTGSGNIAIGLAKFLPGVSIDAIDASPEALEVARFNLQRHRLEAQIRLMQCDFLNAHPALPPQSYRLIVSNPPYVSEREFALLPPEIRVFEPRMATTDGGDGLTFYRVIAEKGKELLSRGGSVIVEMAYDQSASVRRIFEEAGYHDLETVADYSGIERVVRALWR
ncbi:MAG: peptide chain release factor N(5)-glutamine methyltransferase [Bacteroidota bacterium]|jgi:release factor glutamine methyltransferase